MAASLPFFALRRLFAAALLAVAVSALTFLTPTASIPRRSRTNIRCSSGAATSSSRRSCTSTSAAKAWWPRRSAAASAPTFSLLAGALALGLVAGMWGGVVCARLARVTAVLVVIVNGLVDVALAAIDPRVRR